MIPTPSPLIGNSVVMQWLREELECAVRSDAKVLISGENGVGKKVVAQQVHCLSRRSRGPFVSINCGGLSDSLLESELVGVEGRVTGTDRGKPGKLELAANGTLFLDEVGALGLRMQAMLLRFLETGEIERVDCDNKPARVDVRVIAATNRNLVERIAANDFREDLYYRLNVIYIRVPPLREHLGDVPALVDHFLDVFSRLHGVPRPELNLETIARLQRYDWPGNVRELKDVIERLTLRWNPNAPSSMHVLDHVTAPPLPPTPPPVNRAATLHQRMVTNGESFWTVVYEPFMAGDVTRADLQQLVEVGLEETRGSYKRLVALYNVDPGHFKRFMSFLGKNGCHRAFQGFRKAAKSELGSGRGTHPRSVDGAA